MTIDEILERLAESKRLAEIKALHQPDPSQERSYLEGKAAGLSDAIAWIRLTDWSDGQRAKKE